MDKVADLGRRRDISYPSDPLHSGGNRGHLANRGSRLVSTLVRRGEGRRGEFTGSSCPYAHPQHGKCCGLQRTNQYDLSNRRGLGRIGSCPVCTCRHFGATRELLAGGSNAGRLRRASRNGRRPLGLANIVLDGMAGASRSTLVSSAGRHWGHLFRDISARRIFFWNCSYLGEGTEFYLGLDHLGKLVDYFFSFLGLPFTRDPRLGFVGRLVGVLLFLAGLSVIFIATFSNRLSTPLDRIGIGMILLGLGSAAIASVGRGDLIEEVKVPVRYTIFVAMLQVGVLCLLLPRLGQRVAGPGGRLWQQAIGLLLACLLLVLQIFVGRSAEQIASAISEEADCFAQGIRYAEVSHTISPTPEVAQSVLVALRENGLLAPKTVRCAAPPR